MLFESRKCRVRSAAKSWRKARLDSPKEPSFENIEYFLVSDRVLDCSVRASGTSVEAPRERAACLGIGGGRIIGVWPAATFRASRWVLEAERRSLEIIDVGPRPVVPAFVNGHTHLALAPLRGITSVAARSGNVVTDVFFGLERHLTPADVRAFTRFAAYESLLQGVGEVWDHYYFGGEVAAALVEAGLAGVVAPTAQDLSGPGCDRIEEALSDTESIASSLRHSKAGVRAAFGPHATDTVSDAVFQRIGERARQLNVPVHLHLAQSHEEVLSAKDRFPNGLGASVRALLGDARVLIAHGLYLDRAECAELARAGWVLAYCPLSQLQFGFLSPIESWWSSGGQLVLGTDCVASNDALDVQRELPLLGGDASLRVSFSRERRDLLEGRSMATGSLEGRRKDSISEVGPALAEPESLLDIAWGRGVRRLEGDTAYGIAPGARAHLLILNPDHPSLFPEGDLTRTLAYGSTAAAIEWMIVAGRPLGRRAGLVASILDTTDYRETLIEVRKRRDELFARAKISPAH